MLTLQSYFVAYMLRAYALGQAVIDLPGPYGAHALELLVATATMRVKNDARYS